VIDFPSYGMAAEVAQLLSSIWDAEAPPEAPKPNFARIVKDSTNNVRDSLMSLEVELMAV
jgi:hypothetical protein